MTRAPWPLSLARRPGPNGLPPIVLAAVVVAVAIPSMVASLATIGSLLSTGIAFDWENFGAAAARLPHGTLYQFEGFYAFRWSPLAAGLLGLILPMGLTAWRLLHLAVLPLLRDWRLVVACLLAYPFWFDLETGNINTFVAVTAVLALRGSRLATALYLLLLLLVPRPLALPLAAWILWRRPEWRLPFLGLAALNAALVAATGLGGAWLSVLLSAASEIGGNLNLGPSAVIGTAWIPIGLVLAAFLTWRGRIGLASVAASPYWLPYYFLMLLLEFVIPPEAARDGARDPS